MARVITIARQMGSLGDEIAQRVADELRVPLVDREIITRAATLAGVSEESIMEAEKVPSFLERMVSLLGQYPVTWDLDVQTTTATTQPPPISVAEYRRLIDDVVRNIAQTGSAVIVGHGSQLVLKDRTDVVKVFICSSFDLRVERVQEYLKVSKREAEEHVRQDDKERDDYFHTYHRVTWKDPYLYDLCINTSRIGIDAGAEVILNTGKVLEEW